MSSKYITDPMYLDGFKFGSFSDIHWFASFVSASDGSHFSLLKTEEVETVNEDLETNAIKVRLSKIDIPAVSLSSSSIKFLSESVEKTDGQDIEQKGSFSFIDNSSMEYTKAFREKLGLPYLSRYDFSKVHPGFRKDRVNLKITYNDKNTLKGIKTLQRIHIFEDITIIGSNEIEFSWEGTNYKETKVDFVYKRTYGGFDIVNNSGGEK